MDINLIHQYIKGECSLEEKKKVCKWILESEKNKNEYDTLRRLYTISLWHTPELTEPEKSYFQKPSIINYKWRFIAIFIGVIFLAFLFKQENKDILYQTIYVPPGQRVELKLPDSTHVYLNAGTTLKYAMNFATKNREVYLDGEGYFKVKKNKKKPFVVKTNYCDINVLGTEFNVFAYKETSEFITSLINGRIKIVMDENSEPIILTEGDRCVLRNEKLIVEKETDQSCILWKKGIISFKDQPIREIIKKLQSYFNVEVVINNQQLLAKRYTGKFNIKDGIEHILKVIQHHADFYYIRDYENDRIIIN